MNLSELQIYELGISLMTVSLALAILGYIKIRQGKR